MVEMKSRISGIVSSRPAAIGLRMTVWATEMVAPPIRIMVKWRWTSSSLRPVAYGPGNPAQCPGQLRLVRSRENLTHCAAANFAWRTQCGGAVSAWRGGQAATPGGRVMTIRARRTHGARSNNSGTPEVLQCRRMAPKKAQNGTHAPSASSMRGVCKPSAEGRPNRASWPLKPSGDESRCANGI